MEYKRKSAEKKLSFIIKEKIIKEDLPNPV